MKLAESLVLVEFVADIFPEANLIPKDPVLRAQARFFIEVVSSKFVPALQKFLGRGEGYEDLLTAAEAIQNILPASGSYAVGDQYTIADIAITSFLARLKVASANEIGNFAVGQGSELLKALSGEKYAKFHAYVGRLLDRESFRATFDEVRSFPPVGRPHQLSSIERCGHVGIHQSRLCEAVCSSIVSDEVPESRRGRQ